MEDCMEGALDTVLKPTVLDLVPSWISPDHITVARAACLTPLMAYGNQPVPAVGILLFSSACDILDGALARARNQTTVEGAAGDAMADKVFMHGALLSVCFDRVHVAFIVSFLAMDAAIAIVRRIKRRYNAPQDSNPSGKRKTQVLSVAIGLVLTNEPYLVRLAPIGFVIALYYAWKSLSGHYGELRRARAIAFESRASM